MKNLKFSTSTFNSSLLTLNSFGFTMLELIMVMGIISLVATFFVTNFPGATAGARDSQRRSDLKQYQTALESYANRSNGFYPRRDAADISASTTLCSDLGLTNCSNDPKATASVFYRYRSNGSASDGSPAATVFVLWAQLEKKTGSLLDYYIVCSNGLSGIKTAAPGTSACPLP